MATSIVKRHFDVTVTQGAADAFVQGVIDTGILPENGFGLQFNRMEILKTYMPSVNGADRSWSLSRDTKASVVSYDDPDCLYSDGERSSLVTSGAYNYPLREEQFLSDFFVVEPSLYFQLDSTATTLVNVFKVRLHYDEVKLSEVEILRILNNS